MAVNKEPRPEAIEAQLRMGHDEWPIDTRVRVIMGRYNRVCGRVVGYWGTDRYVVLLNRAGKRTLHRSQLELRRLGGVQ